MTIDETIEAIEELLEYEVITQHRNLGEALRLAIEALRVIQVARASNARLVDPLLPGETE